MKWRQVIGQEKAVSYLQQSFEQGRVPHAILISGPAGTCQLALALSYASLLQCESPVHNEACGHCNACIKSSKLIHPDINFIFPVASLEGKKSSVDFMQIYKEAVLANPYMSAEQWANTAGIADKKININAADIRSVIQTLSFSRFEGRKRIMIIWLPEYLGKEGNILLKLIEEPEENTHIILVTENKMQILGTILSRCQIVDTRLIDETILANALRERYDSNEAAAQQAAWLGDGRYHQAVAALEGTQSQVAGGFLQWLRLCYKGNGIELSDWMDEFAKLSFESQKHFYTYGLHFLQQVLRAKYIPETEWRLDEEEKKAVKNLIKIMHEGVVYAISERLNQDIAHLHRNANAKMLMLSSSIFTHKVLRGQVPTSILAQP